jgi:hypothetical protein
MGTTVHKLGRKYQCGGSGMFIPDPGSWFLPIPDPGSRIPDPKTATKERGEEKFVVIAFYVAKNFTKLQITLVWSAEEKNLGQSSKNYRTFYPKIVTKLSKIWIWDPGSEIWDPEKNYSRSRIQRSKRHRIPDPDLQLWKIPTDEWMYLQSIKSVKHNAANSVNRSILKKSRHIGFGVFIVRSSMTYTEQSHEYTRSKNHEYFKKLTENHSSFTLLAEVASYW